MLNPDLTETFAGAGSAGMPRGWRQEAGGAGAAAVVDAGRGPELVVSGAGGPALIVRGGARFDPPLVETRLRFAGSGGRAGVVLGYAGPTDYVAVLVDEATDRVEVWEVVDGAARLAWASAAGAIVIEPGRDNWLRAEAGSDGTGRSWVSVWWTDGTATWRALGAAEGVGHVAGGIGLMADGATAIFDDVAARRSAATAAAPAEAALAPTPVADAPATEEPTGTPMPAPTETPVPIATETPMPVPTETPAPAPTETPAPIATETPAPMPTEPPVPPEPSPTEPSTQAASDGEDVAAREPTTEAASQ